MLISFMLPKPATSFMRVVYHILFSVIYDFVLLSQSWWQFA